MCLWMGLNGSILALAYLVSLDDLVARSIVVDYRAAKKHHLSFELASLTEQYDVQGRPV